MEKGNLLTKSPNFVFLDAMVKNSCILVIIFLLCAMLYHSIPQAKWWIEQRTIQNLAIKYDQSHWSLVEKAVVNSQDDSLFIQIECKHNCRLSIISFTIDIYHPSYQNLKNGNKGTTYYLTKFDKVRQSINGYSTAMDAVEFTPED